MKATALLEAQHREVEAILEKLDKGKGDPTALLKELADNLAAHMAIEQQIFYPMVREADPELIDESYEEHAIAELALKRLLRTTKEDSSFQAKVTSLKELIMHHVKEEEDDLFPAVEKKLNGDKLEQLGTQLEKTFKESKAQGYAALVPDGFSTTSADEFEKLVRSATPRDANAQGGSARGRASQ